MTQARQQPAGDVQGTSPGDHEAEQRARTPEPEARTTEPEARTTNPEARTTEPEAGPAKVEPEAEPSSASVADAPSRRRSWAGFTVDGAAALVTWLVATPLAVLLAWWADLDPFTVAGVVMPVGVGALAGGILLAVALRRCTDVLVGVAMGVYAAWIALTMATTLHGTPYGYGMLAGDAGRFVAQANKYMYTSGSADSFVKGLPSEYPPLYPWIVGHVARLVDKPAWQLFGEMQIVVMSLAVVLAYVFWRRLVAAPVAFALVGLAPLVFREPSKDYEFVALLVYAPWVIMTFAGLPRRRGGLHWLPAGIIGGLLVLTYQAWLMFSALGLLALILLTLRVVPSKGRYLLHLLGVAVTAFVVSSWYVIPLVSTMVTGGQNRLSDFWMSGAIVDRPVVFPFLQPTVVGLITLVGLLGMVWYRRTTFWAQPLLLIVAGCYAYRVLFLLRTAYDNHTGYLQYTETLIGMVLLTAGVLTTVEAAPGLWRRLRATTVAPAGAAAPPPGSAVAPVGPVAAGRVRGPERAVLVTAVAALVAYAGMQGWVDWVPGPRGIRDSVKAAGGVTRGTDAHAEPLPDGSYPRFAPPAQYLHGWMPVEPIEKAVEKRLGSNARPVVLSYDQRLFAFLPWYGYTATDRVSANSLLRWDDRYAELQKLSRVTDPAQFAKASQATAFGPIDVFVLKRASGDRYRWKDVFFPAKAFDPAVFDVQRVPSNAVVVVRRP